MSIKLSDFLLTKRNFGYISHSESYCYLNLMANSLVIGSSSLFKMAFLKSRKHINNSSYQTSQKHNYRIEQESLLFSNH